MWRGNGKMVYIVLCYNALWFNESIYIYIYIYRSLGVVSDKIAQLSATPYKRKILRRRRRLLLIIIIIIIIIIVIGDARGRVKVVANPGNRDRVCSPWCVVARDRWHRAWRAIDGTVRGAIDGTVRGAIDGTVDNTYKQ